MLARVSHIETFRRWRDFIPKHENDIEPTLEEVVASITTDQPSEAMLAGTAFHKALERASDGTHFELAANGYTFMLRGGELEIPDIREQRAYTRYGELTVTGQVDAIHGRTVTDYKTTKKIDVERYLAGCQWQFYLDLFDADTFRWTLFEISDMGQRTYDVQPPQHLTEYRYPGLHEFCADLAADYLEFARHHLPERFVREAA